MEDQGASLCSGLLVKAGLLTKGSSIDLRSRAAAPHHSSWEIVRPAYALHDASAVFELVLEWPSFACETGTPESSGNTM
jgi:hypothetical protein